MNDTIYRMGLLDEDLRERWGTNHRKYQGQYQHNHGQYYLSPEEQRHKAEKDAEEQEEREYIRKRLDAVPRVRQVVDTDDVDLMWKQMKSDLYFCNAALDSSCMMDYKMPTLRLLMRMASEYEFSDGSEETYGYLNHFGKDSIYSPAQTWYYVPENLHRMDLIHKLASEGYGPACLQLFRRNGAFSDDYKTKKLKEAIECSAAATNPQDMVRLEDLTDEEYFILAGHLLESSSGSIKAPPNGQEILAGDLLSRVRNKDTTFWWRVMSCFKKNEKVPQAVVIDGQFFNVQQVATNIKGPLPATGNEKQYLDKCLQYLQEDSSHDSGESWNNFKQLVRSTEGLEMALDCGNPALWVWVFRITKSDDYAVPTAGGLLGVEEACLLYLDSLRRWPKFSDEKLKSEFRIEGSVPTLKWAIDMGDQRKWDGPRSVVCCTRKIRTDTVDVVRKILSTKSGCESTIGCIYEAESKKFSRCEYVYVPAAMPRLNLAWSEIYYKFGCCVDPNDSARVPIAVGLMQGSYLSRAHFFHFIAAELWAFASSDEKVKALILKIRRAIKLCKQFPRNKLVDVDTTIALEVRSDSGTSRLSELYKPPGSGRVRHGKAARHDKAEAYLKKHHLTTPIEAPKVCECIIL